LKTRLKILAFHHILLFEKEFDGIMPLKLQLIQKKKGLKLSTLRKMDELFKTIEKAPELSNQSPFLI
jgi:hypothetical protein